MANSETVQSIEEKPLSNTKSNISLICKTVVQAEHSKLNNKNKFTNKSFPLSKGEGADIIPSEHAKSNGEATALQFEMDSQNLTQSQEEMLQLKTECCNRHSTLSENILAELEESGQKTGKDVIFNLSYFLNEPEQECHSKSKVCQR